MIRPGSALADLSVRELQAYGALCLAKYCDAGGLQHPAIKTLADHLVSLLVAEDLPAWEAAGATLQLSGRGDPAPDSVRAAVPSILWAGFQRLVACAVEIGIVDIYGKSSGRPRDFAEQCAAVLAAHGVDPPDPSVVKGAARPLTSAWGDPVSAEEYQRIRELCRDMLSFK